MSRHGYTESDGDDGLQANRWRGVVASATRGKRGQAFFVALVEALDAMPEKKLCEGNLETPEGSVCALGALGRARGLSLAGIGNEEFPDEEWEDSDWGKLGKMFDIAPVLAQEVMYKNDESAALTDEGRWKNVRAWALRQIRPETLVPEEVADGKG